MEKKMQLVNVGYGNFVSVAHILSISAYVSQPVKTMVQTAKNDGMAVDATCGKKTKAVILTDEKILILSALSPATLQARIENADNAFGKEEENEV